VSGSAGIHHPIVTLQRHLLQSSHETRCVPLRLAAGLLRNDRSVGLGSRPEESRAAALLSATRALAADAGAARLTLLAPWIDADPWAIRVWRTRLLVPAAAVALAVVLPPPLLAAAAALVLRLLLLHQELLRRSRRGGATGGAAK